MDLIGFTKLFDTGQILKCLKIIEKIKSSPEIKTANNSQKFRLFFVESSCLSSMGHIQEAKDKIELWDGIMTAEEQIEFQVLKLANKLQTYKVTNLPDLIEELAQGISSKTHLEEIKKTIFLH